MRLLNSIARAVVVAAMVYPVGYYVHFVEANLAHVLYSPKPWSVVLTRSGETYSLAQRSYEETGAFIPPLHRLHIAVFRATGERGDTLVLYDPRPYATKERRVRIDDE